MQEQTIRPGPGFPQENPGKVDLPTGRISRILFRHCPGFEMEEVCVQESWQTHQWPNVQGFTVGRCLK